MTNPQDPYNRDTDGADRPADRPGASGDNTGERPFAGGTQGGSGNQGYPSYPCLLYTSPSPRD